MYPIFEGVARNDLNFALLLQVQICGFITNIKKNHATFRGEAVQGMDNGIDRNADLLPNYCLTVT